MQTALVDLAAEKVKNLAVAIQARILEGRQLEVPECNGKDRFTELVAMHPSSFAAFIEGAGEVCGSGLVVLLNIRFCCSF